MDRERGERGRGRGDRQQAQAQDPNRINRLPKKSDVFVRQAYLQLEDPGDEGKEEEGEEEEEIRYDRCLTGDEFTWTVIGDDNDRW